VVVAGLVGVAVGMALAAWRSMRWTLYGRESLGLVTAATCALGAVAATLLLAGPLVALTLPTAVTLLGFALARVPRDDGPDEADDASEPPWWPSFERDLRRYERSAVRPRRG
jgi:peptidoglycan/LPS O-acetylase OafA/YrhL